MGLRRLLSTHEPSALNNRGRNVNDASPTDASPPQAGHCGMHDRAKIFQGICDTYTGEMCLHIRERGARASAVEGRTGLLTRRH
jgi:hypothetical protein